jgi:cyclopropane fatty-acyl-phospholipid synthase-like methyltransferase
MNPQFWNARYDQPDYVYGLAPNEYFKKKIDALTPGELLLPLEGEGRNALYACQKGWLVDAVDFSDVARKKAVDLFRQHNCHVNYSINEIQDFTPPRRYDAISLIYAHFSEDNREAIHRSFIQYLKPGGFLILEAFHKKQLGKNSGGPQNISMLYDEELLARDFQDMKFLEITETQKELNEGDHHKGIAHIIRWFMQKPQFL